MQKKSLAMSIVQIVPFLLLTIFLLYPVLGVLVQGLLDKNGTPFMNVLISPVTQKTLSFTIVQALCSTLLTVLVGLPGGFLLARLEFKGKSILRAIIILPFILPPIVVVVGFLQMLGSQGFLDSALMMITGTNESVINLAEGVTGIILAHTFYNIPLVILMVASKLERLDPDVEESAELLGASEIQKMRRIILPHILPSLLAASLLTFLFCFMSFPIVLALGEGKYMTLEVQLYYAFRNFDYGEASSVGIIQIMFMLTLAVVYAKMGKSNNENLVKTAQIKTISFKNLQPRNQIITMVYLILVGILVAGPLIAVINASIYDPIMGEYTLRGFTTLFQGGTSGGLLPLVNSIFYAALSTFLAVIFGIPLAYALRSRNKGKSTITSIMILLPLGISSITIAYGLMRIIAVPTGLTASPWPLIIIAQTIIGIPFTSRAIEGSLRDIDQDILDQADSLGVTRLQKLFYVELPLLVPGILVGAAFAFAMSIGEMSATLFIARPENINLSVAIYLNLGVRKFVEAGAASVVLLVICLIAFLIIQRVSDNSLRSAL